MIATIWGSRGSLATPGPATIEYGGNTACVELRLADGSTVVLDAGTGIRELGLRLANRPPAPLHLLLTHLHLDHLAGLPFFAPLWDPRAEIHIWAPPSPPGRLADAIASSMSPPLFPVPISEVPATVSFHDLPERAWTLGSARVLAEPVTHRGPTVGYRVEEESLSLAYLPDHEPFSDVQTDVTEPERLSGFRLARSADILIHDAQYFEDEYPGRIGWGHSSVAHAVAFARAARASRLVLFHHDLLHSDDGLTALEARAAELWNDRFQQPVLAREGMRLELAGEVEPASRASAARE